MNIKHVILCGGSNSIWKRQIFLCSKKLKNYYDRLGVSPSATQTEIKNSYYELSKLYHPDIAENKEDNVQKFREICEAYDILGNVKSRKLYDKGAFIKGKIDIKSDVSENEAVSRAKVKQKVSPSSDSITQSADIYMREHLAAQFTAFQNLKFDQTDELRSTYDLNTSYSFGIVMSGLFVVSFVFYMLWEIEDRRKL